MALLSPLSNGSWEQRMGRAPGEDLQGCGSQARALLCPWRHSDLDYPSLGPGAQRARLLQMTLKNKTKQKEISLHSHFRINIQSRNKTGALKLNFT